MKARPRWAAKAERGSGAALRLAVRITRFFGRPVMAALLHPIALYFLLTDREARRASLDYFRRLDTLPEGRAARAHPERAPDWRDTYRQLFEFSTSIYDRICVWSGQDQGFSLQHDAEAHFAHLPAASGASANGLGKSGALILSAHLGSFDMMRSICLDADIPVKAVMYGGNSQTINHFMQGLNPKLQFDLIEVRPGSHVATLQVRSAVQEGDFVAIMGDRPGLGSSHQRVNFLGAEAFFATGPFELATLIGCPILLATATRVASRCYQVESEPLYTGGRVPRAERAKVVRELVEGYARFLERGCVAHPYQWFNFFDFWGGDAAAAQRSKSEATAQGEA